MYGEKVLRIPFPLGSHKSDKKTGRRRKKTKRFAYKFYIPRPRTLIMTLITTAATTAGVHVTPGFKSTDHIIARIQMLPSTLQKGKRK
jgi:hypothetical protein